MPHLVTHARWASGRSTAAAAAAVLLCAMLMRACALCLLCVCVWCALVSDGAGMQAWTIMASCLVLGIVLGSTFSFAVKFAYTGTDPFCAS